MSRLNLCLVVVVFLATYGASGRPVQEGFDFVVAQDGSGDYKTVQEAIHAVPDFRKNTTTIFIKKGVYKEKVVVPESKKNIALIGEDVLETVLTYADYASKKNRFGEEVGTSGSASFYNFGDDLRVENVTFENSSGPVGQAVAAFVAGDRITFVNCRFLGHQDTLYTYGKRSRQYYYRCYIEGTVDFIFGSSTAWFEDCEIRCKGKGYITAASTPEDVAYGYVFNRCRVTGGQDTETFYLGRPWRPYAKVLFMQCDLPAFIRAEGWHNWGKESNEKTVWFAEYHNTGKGAVSQNRVSWAKQLTEEEFLTISLSTVFNGWRPTLTIAEKLVYR